MRTLKYFGIQAKKLIVFDILIGIAYGVIFGTMLSDGKDNLIGMVMTYMITMEIITIIVTHVSLVKMNMPLALSMGGRRKEIFLGAQWTVALLIVQLLVFFSLAKIVFFENDMEYLGFIYEFLPHICIAGASLSEFLAVLTLKFGGKGTMIGTVLMSLAGSFSVIVVSSDGSDFNSYLFTDSFKMFLLSFLILIYVIITAVYYDIWKKYELRAF